MNDSPSATIAAIGDRSVTSFYSDATDLTVSLVAAFVAHNATPAYALPSLLRSVHSAITGLGAPAVEKAAAAPLTPAVPVKKSVTDEYLISLEDGRKLKLMKRYLAGLGMTPDQYRAKWGLPGDYPMVAPAYAAKRSELAKSLGLGKRTPVAEAA